MTSRDAATVETELMDIHEAARFLRVSEVSVRRYTNNGVLPCLRVGGRRERRFRRADLEAFLGGAPQPGAAPTNAGRLSLDGVEVAYGSHLCQLYETDRGRTQMSAPFLADGLSAGDACFLIASDTNRDAILSAMRKRRAAVDVDLSTGRLRFVPCAENGKAMLAALERAFGAALDDGYDRMRLVGDMAWFLDQGLSGEELVDFESLYDSQIGHSYPIVSLCLYDARRFSGVDLLHALKCHSDTHELPLSRFLLR